MRLECRHINKLYIISKWTKSLTSQSISASFKLLSFSLIQPYFLKLVQLVQFDKTSHAWHFMELVIVLDTGGTDMSVAYLGEHQTCNLSAWVQSLQKYCLVFNILD